MTDQPPQQPNDVPEPREPTPEHAPDSLPGYESPDVKSPGYQSPGAPAPQEAPDGPLPGSDGSTDEGFRRVADDPDKGPTPTGA